MNIGIVTCWKPDDNYGTQIQCFALQTYLRSLGHNAYLIRYSRNNDLIKIPVTQRKLYNIFNPVKVVKILYVTLLSKKIKKEGELYDRDAPAFREKYLKQSREYPNINALKTDPPEADIYIVGSDQVWNINYRQVNNLMAHFLDFGDEKTKRISYAASFGFGLDRLSDGYINAVFPLLKRFNGISVREESGCEICKKIGINNVEQVCDPTFLIRPEQYLDYFKNENIVLPNEDYIFVYNLSSTSELNIDNIEKWADTNNYKVIYVTGHGRADKVEKCYPTIPEWVYLIANARFVITNSFHGAVFSLMFHKELAVYPITGSSFGNPNSRLETLEFLAGKKIIADDCDPFTTILSKKTDWKSFESRKEDLVSIGKAFLNRFLC